MIVPDTNLRQRSAGGSLLRRVIVLVLIIVVGWIAWVYGQIRYYADRDEASAADAIAVFGAAEYDGRPSPVLRARLDHALELYGRELAPLIITLGGSDVGDQHSEGSVGHDYLLAHGVPETAIIAETQSENTEESAARLARIARANHLNRVIVVSDGTHLFRIHALCEKVGLTVYTSPRAVARSIGWQDSFSRMAHEIISYTAWRLHLH
ncbi:YdcF family protein [Alloacidobacterium dinghuense]|uniref:YdcF family protein n=1 Tax=Alloacidobacterium dinghuense TaxID=2763107 RepID=A0A7G8BKN2_9BACT|nr:YdcF family protein [Alloacidobacterium dinghuense]QNI33102.1 YdcF family protein [Alloacidobacterium dinghuense]